MKFHNALLAGLAARLALMPFFGHPYDVYSWYTICQEILAPGPFAVGYFPPMLFYTLVPIAHLYTWMAGALGVQPIPIKSIPEELNPFPQFAMGYFTPIVFNFVVKIPFLLADLLTALVLYKVVKAMDKSERLAQKAALLWFLNPYLIWISAGWGMFDSLPALFSTVCFLAFLKRRYVASALCLAIAVAYKLYPILLLVPITLYVIRARPDGISERTTILVKFLITFVACSAILFSPVLHLVLVRSERLLSSPPEFGRLGFGLTYWSILLAVKADQNFVAIASNSTLVVLLLLVYWRAIRMRLDRPALELASLQLSCVLAIFLSFRFFCEQYFVWALPFMAITAVERRTEELIYRLASLIALGYSLVNLLPPFFLLSTSPWTKDILLAAVRFLRHGGNPAEGPGNPLAYLPHLSASTILLTVLGTAFSILMALAFVEAVWTPGTTLLAKILPAPIRKLLEKLRLLQSNRPRNASLSA